MGSLRPDDEAAGSIGAQNPAPVWALHRPDLPFFILNRAVPFKGPPGSSVHPATILPLRISRTKSHQQI